MRGHEILSSIAWSPDVSPKIVAEINAAILDLDRKVHGTNRPKFSWPEAHKRLTAFINDNGGYRQAAAVAGISKSYLFDMHSGTRPVSDALLRRLGLERSVSVSYLPTSQ